VILPQPLGKLIDAVHRSSSGCAGSPPKQVAGSGSQRPRQARPHRGLSTASSWAVSACLPKVPGSVVAPDRRRGAAPARLPPVSPTFAIPAPDAGV
jgi:hypothetical protein